MDGDAEVIQVSFDVFVSESREAVLCRDGDVGDVAVLCEFE